MINSVPQNPDDSPVVECSAAIKSGLQALTEANIEGGPYKLVAVESLLKGAVPESDPNVWRLTFKAHRLIPPEAGIEIGAGGEIFIEVNLKSGQARLTGRGD